MKKIILSLIILLGSFAGFSQASLQVLSNPKGLYIEHTVVPKENFYSIGRLYNISPKEIAAFNNLDMNNGLNAGQAIMIPLEKNNFSQTRSEGTPVYYTVGENEGLYRVSLKNNKVLMANLRKWNHLTNDNINSGSKLIVGYLVSPELAKNSGVIAAKNNNQPATQRTKATDEVEKENTVVTPPQPNPVVTAKQDDKMEEAPKAEVKKTNPEMAVPNPAATSGSESGYFKTVYDQQVKTYAPSKDQTVRSGIFKTASGWQDGKFYALLDGVEPGTIIRIINPNNSKTIYAKVLGQMSGIRQNQGLDLRISNAGADALSVADPEKFIVRVIY